VVMTSRRSRTVVDLTCRHKNQALLVEGPEIMIRPVGTRPQSMVVASPLTSYKL
jgi:hypothetical protein